MILLNRKVNISDIEDIEEYFLEVAAYQSIYISAIEEDFDGFEGLPKDLIKELIESNKEEHIEMQERYEKLFFVISTYTFNAVNNKEKRDMLKVLEAQVLYYQHKFKSVEILRSEVESFKKTNYKKGRVSLDNKTLGEITK